MMTMTMTMTMPSLSSSRRRRRRRGPPPPLAALLLLLLLLFLVLSMSTPALVAPVGASEALLLDDDDIDIDNDDKTSATTQPISYVLLAVSGTLEEGFELRRHLDYRSSASSYDDDTDNSNETRGGTTAHDNVVPATFLGKVLVRGYKSFLDIKNPGWREYKDDDDNNNEKNERYKTVNPAAVPTGCDEHANRYSVYAVDSRQALAALAGEPRFLAIAPDAGIADLTHSDDDIRKLSRAYARDPKLSGLHAAAGPNMNEIAFLTVTSVWLKGTFVENGVARVIEEEEDDDEDSEEEERGDNQTTRTSTRTKRTTYVTDFAESTAIWSRRILNSTRGLHREFPQGCGSNPFGNSNGGNNGTTTTIVTSTITANVDTPEAYRRCIDAAIRMQEEEYVVTTPTSAQQQPPSIVGGGTPYADFEYCSPQTATKKCFVCQRQARYGVDARTARFNKVLTACQLENLMVRAGVVDLSDPKQPKYKLQGCSLGRRPSSSSAGSVALTQHPPVPPSAQVTVTTTAKTTAAVAVVRAMGIVSTVVAIMAMIFF